MARQERDFEVFFFFLRFFCTWTKKRVAVAQFLRLCGTSARFLFFGSFLTSLEIPRQCESYRLVKQTTRMPPARAIVFVRLRTCTYPLLYMSVRCFCRGGVESRTASCSFSLCVLKLRLGFFLSLLLRFKARLPSRLLSSLRHSREVCILLACGICLYSPVHLSLGLSQCLHACS